MSKRLLFLLLLITNTLLFPAVPLCDDDTEKECTKWCSCVWNNQTGCDYGDSQSEMCVKQLKLTGIIFWVLCSGLFVCCLVFICYCFCTSMFEFHKKHILYNQIQDPIEL